MNNPIIEGYAKERGISYEEAVKKTIESYNYMKEAFEEIAVTETTMGKTE